MFYCTIFFLTAAYRTNGHPTHESFYRRGGPLIFQNLDRFRSEMFDLGARANVRSGNVVFSGRRVVGTNHILRNVRRAFFVVPEAVFRRDHLRETVAPNQIFDVAENLVDPGLAPTAGVRGVAPYALRGIHTEIDPRDDRPPRLYDRRPCGVARRRLNGGMARARSPASSEGEKKTNTRLFEKTFISRYTYKLHRPIVSVLARFQRAVADYLGKTIVTFVHHVAYSELCAHVRATGDKVSGPVNPERLRSGRFLPERTATAFAVAEALALSGHPVHLRLRLCKTLFVAAIMHHRVCSGTTVRCGGSDECR